MACERMSCLHIGDSCVEEVYIYPQYENEHLMGIIPREICISKFSCSSKRCPPLVVLYSIVSNGVCLKMEPKEKQSPPDYSDLKTLHNSCLKEAKTAIVSLGRHELHLVAMLSRDMKDQMPCFWGFYIEAGLYEFSLAMLNRRSLALVFDLDKTLVVASTMRSFEDRLRALRRKVSEEVDPKRVFHMSAEIGRYEEDKKILKQYIDGDQVCDDEVLIKAQPEIFPPPSDKHELQVRPIIRLQKQNIILTRINPNNRDTSVLVRIRPGWEEFRNDLISNGRKRFEVFICTMSQKEYALEMLRLLDPHAALISSTERYDRVFCVNPCLRKSLLNVFSNRVCYPKMALVVDDLSEVWEDGDQRQVHRLPAFEPYSSSSAETTLPTLSVTSTGACNVRARFFNYFDHCFMEEMANVYYESCMRNLPAAPDVAHFLAMEKETITNAYSSLSVLNGIINRGVVQQPALQNQNVHSTTVAACAVSEKEEDRKTCMEFLVQAQRSNKLLESSDGVKYVASSDSGQSANASADKEDGEIPESEFDPDTKRRLLILQHGQDPGQYGLNSCDPSLMRSLVETKLILAEGEGKVLETSHGIAIDSQIPAINGRLLKSNAFKYGPLKTLRSPLKKKNTGTNFVRQAFKIAHRGDSKGSSGCSRRFKRHNRRWGGNQATTELQFSKKDIDVSVSKEENRHALSTSRQSKRNGPVKNYSGRANHGKDDHQPCEETMEEMTISRSHATIKEHGRDDDDGQWKHKIIKRRPRRRPSKGMMAPFRPNKRMKHANNKNG